MEEGRHKAEGRRQKAEGRRQKAEGRREEKIRRDKVFLSRSYPDMILQHILYQIQARLLQ
ncbi:hypothetical protein D5R40_07815 [Okeania hirsuta]|uniref:Uncharacterized protein n=1 Tax=Okeania hirsuta TaxID=1458930 RepID=A0A3N6PYS0_9CYAN|nr:hypothetical protein D5R40_07815 [Okeania hirsuta]